MASKSRLLATQQHNECHHDDDCGHTGMGIATPPSQSACPPYLSPQKLVSRTSGRPNSPTSMSQGFHHGIFGFSDGFDRSTSQDQQQQHVAQQSRRDKLRVQGFEPGGHSLVPIEDQGEESSIYDSTAAAAGASNMLSEMFNFPTSDLLASQIYRQTPRPGPMAGFSGDWYGPNRQGVVLGGANNLISLGESTVKHHHGGSQQQQPISGLNADSAAAMQLFLMNPTLQPPPPQQQHQRSPSPPPPAPPPTLHHHHHHQQQAFQSFGDASFSGGVGESQGLSLSLSSSLQQFEMPKAEELRVRDGVLYFNNQAQQQQQHHPPSLHLQGHGHGHGQAVHIEYGPMGVVNVLRNSKYARAAQELLEEFCSVGRSQLKGSRIGRHRSSSSNPNLNPIHGGGGGASSSAAAAVSSSSSKDLPPLSPADRFEHQRKKAKLISMLDEVDRRYNHYCDQMQMVVNSFDTVMGFGAATPYTALAQKAMSRHFRCLKDAIAAQLKQTCEVLGEKEAGSSSGLTKGETPRLRLVDQNLRQQRAFHQMGMLEQEAWRPQRGLPERSVNILRAWLFEHFLHPYPSDADKHLLARQTGLSRNQVSNWFINARVRLWKPMVEDMYQQESKEDGEEGEMGEADHQGAQSPAQQQQQQPQGQKPDTNAPSEIDTSLAQPPTSRHHPHHHHHHHLLAGSSSSSADNPPPATVGHPSSGGAAGGGDDAPLVGIDAPELCRSDVHLGPTNVDTYRYGATSAATLGPASQMRFGTAGDVSLTLGLRHAGGNAAEKGRFSVRDFNGC